MDLNSFERGSDGEDLTYSFYPAGSSFPSTLYQSLKLEPRNSPNSPFLTHFDTDVLTPAIDTPEQFSSTDNPSEATFSPNSSEDIHLIRYSAPSLQNISKQHIQHALQELETVLMAPDDYNEVITSDNFLMDYKNARGERSRAGNHGPQGPYSYRSESSHHSHFINLSNEFYAEKAMEELAVQGVHPNNLEQQLIACARALFENKLDEFEKLVMVTRASVSVSGEPIQRLGAYMLEGLIARKELSGTIIYRSLKCNNPDSKDLLSYMHILYEICPYLKFGHMAANGAIAEACKNENRIHIVDFQIAQGTQWMTLLEALAARPSGPPNIRITGIDDPVSKHARGDGLSAVGRRLAAISAKFNIPIEFNAVPVFSSDITRELLDVKPGEALAVNFPLQLHHTPDESVDVSNPRDALLRMIKSLSPKVVTLVEQESNTNTSTFPQRFDEALHFYKAMFESIDDSTMARDSKERIKVEEHCLAKDIVSIIACEGRERVERHELLSKWRLRFMMAGFRQFPLSSYVNSVIRELLGHYSEHYTLREIDGAMLLGWKERYLVSASAWH